MNRQHKSIEVFLVNILILVSVARGLSTGGFIHPPTTEANALRAKKIGDEECESSCIALVDCAIVGGGPAGLATAIALTKASPSSSIAVFERDNFQPKGASIQISKPGWSSLKELDDIHMNSKTIDDGSGKLKRILTWKGSHRHSHSRSLVSELMQTNVPVTSIEIKTWIQQKKDEEDTDMKKSSKRVLIRRSLKKYVSKITKSALSTLFRLILTTSKRSVHLWHDVRIALLDHAVHLYAIAEDTHTGGTPFLNPNCGLVKIVHMEESKGQNDGDEYRFQLTFQDTDNGEERTIKTKYLFACDGTKSMVRSILPNEPNILLAENKSVWRGMAPNFDAKGKATFFRGVKDTSTSGGNDSENNHTTSNSTEGRSALIFPGGKNAGSSWTVISDIEDGKSTSMEEAKRRVLKVIATMGEDNPDYKLLEQIINDSSTVIENKLHVRDFENAPWESSYDGLIYIGDSAHPVRPTGEGTALAFEDANVLCKVVTEYGLGVEALRNYETERFIPVKTISEKVRANAQNFYNAEVSDDQRREATASIYDERTSETNTDTVLTR